MDRPGVKSEEVFPLHRCSSCGIVCLLADYLKGLREGYGTCIGCNKDTVFVKKARHFSGPIETRE